MKKLALLVMIALGVCCTSIHRPQAATPATVTAPARAEDLPGGRLRVHVDHRRQGPQDGRAQVACAKGDAHCIAVLNFDGDVNEKHVDDAVTFLQGADTAGVTRIVIQIDTPGGDVGGGFKLMRAIEETKTPILCLVDGSAASMGYFFLQSCPVRVMTTRSTLMAHQALIPEINPATIRILKKALADLGSTSAGLAAQGQRRLNVSMAAYLAKVDDKDWFMSANEAFSVGAVDCLFNGNPTEAKRQLGTTGQLTCSKGTAKVPGLPDPIPKKK